MFRSRVLLFVLLLCLPAVWSASAPRPDEENTSTQKVEPITFAVADFDGSDKELGRFLSETFLTNLAQSKALRLVERVSIRQALAELKLQSSGLVEPQPQDVKKLGKLLGADHLIVGSFYAHNDALTINVRLLDVKTGQLVPGMAASVSGNSGDPLNLVTRLAQQFYHRITGKDLFPKPETPVSQTRTATASAPAYTGDVMAYGQQLGLIPLNVRPGDAVLENDLVHLVNHVSRLVSAANNYALDSKQPTLPVTRIRVLSALVKLLESPDTIRSYRADPSRPRPSDGDAIPMWGQPYVAAALTEGWLRSGERFKPRNSANWTFVASLIARMPLDDSRSARVETVAVAPPEPAPIVSVSSVSDDTKFTGLVIDAGEFDVQRAMSARILDEEGRVLYPDPKRPLDLDFLQEHGIVAYCETVEKAKRAGEHPFIVSAIALSGPLHCDLVVSDAIAEKIRQADRNGKFLSQWAVCFLYHNGK